MGRELAGKRLGLVGYGAIARVTGRMARDLGMSVGAYDPLLPEDPSAWAGAQRQALPELLSTSDVVSLHVPLTDATRNMLDATAIAGMKPGALLINAARGGVVDEAAVCASLRSGQLGGAALDVFAREPVDATSGAQFAGVPNLILTPHIAGVTEESNVRVSAVTAEAIARHLDA
jgi:(S)-sulfolactate dehydrogenase